ncbi:MAG TPA: cbb3-type cytochrome c oxidase subunit I [Blastocatellia bacterium]|nr:cbb3-type cytochrome c oxidase subunit I [Blastocatellia bacterium]
MAEVIHPTHGEIHRHEPPKGFIRKYIFSLDHKVIGIQYFFLALFSVLVGLVLSVLMRLQLAWPNQEFGFLKVIFPTAAESGTISPDLYLSLVTMHGTIMVFFVLTTAPQGGFGNYFLPIQIGAADMAFPLLNALSFWTTFLALGVMMMAFFAATNTIGPIGGWTGYAPLSALGERAGPGQGLGVILWISSIGLFCVASLLGALNFITTMLNMRARGMSLMRLPLTCWAWFTTAVLSLLSFPVLLAAAILLIIEHQAGTSFFIPGGEYVSGKLLEEHKGGSPILWQHLFWFFGHPEVYIAILPGMGLTSHILATFARKPVFGYRAMVFAIFAIGLLGFFVWGHHMFMSGMDPRTAIMFSLITLTIGVPSAIKTFNWLGTIWGGQIRFTAPMLYAIGFVSLFVSGGITGLFLGQTSIDIPLHDTYFVVGHFHLIMGVAAIFGIFMGTQFWFPKMFGRMMSESLGKLHFWLTFIGVNCIFIPMHIMGMMGAPRRYSTHYNLQYLSELPPLTHFVSYAAFFTAAVQLIFVVNLFWSMFKGPKASDNPWEATTLEWTIPSPPPHDNFEGIEPEVYRGPYEYSVPGASKDYSMQTEPDEAVRSDG